MVDAAAGLSSEDATTAPIVAPAPPVAPASPVVPFPIVVPATPREVEESLAGHPDAGKYYVVTHGTHTGVFSNM